MAMKNQIFLSGLCQDSDTAVTFGDIHLGGSRGGFSQVSFIFSTPQNYRPAGFPGCANTTGQLSSVLSPPRPKCFPFYDSASGGKTADSGARPLKAQQHQALCGVWATKPAWENPGDGFSTPQNPVSPTRWNTADCKVLMCPIPIMQILLMGFTLFPKRIPSSGRALSICLRIKELFCSTEN